MYKYARNRMTNNGFLRTFSFFPHLIFIPLCLAVYRERSNIQTRMYVYENKTTKHKATPRSSLQFRCPRHFDWEVSIGKFARKTSSFENDCDTTELWQRWRWRQRRRQNGICVHRTAAKRRRRSKKKKTELFFFH
jgi:hypothetical protein